ncbi:DUF6083 domain-containing protein [Streptomyces sp. NPDC054933]
MRVWSSSASKTLRAQAQSRCVYCNHMMEYFDRYDGGRIPLVPKELPSAQIPQRFRWCVDNGVAYRGDGGRARCRLPHPTACPMVEHDDHDAELEGLRRVLAVRTRKWIDEGSFVPRPHPLDEDDVAEQHVCVVAGATRHIVKHATALWLAPRTVDSIQCVAHAASTNQRCQKVVLEPTHDEGSWQLVDIPEAAGRAGQRVLWAGELMWVWVLHALDFDVLQRWVKQRCTSHWPSPAHDAVSPEWVHFHPVRHDKHIVHERPADPQKALPSNRGNPLLEKVVSGPKRTICAGQNCRNGSAAPVEEGWLCYRCRPKLQRRATIHRKWQPSRESDT